MCGVAALVAAHPVASGAGGEAAEGRRGRSWRRRGGAGGDAASPCSAVGGGPGQEQLVRGPPDRLGGAEARGRGHRPLGRPARGEAPRLRAAALGRARAAAAGLLAGVAALAALGRAVVRRVRGRPRQQFLAARACSVAAVRARVEGSPGDADAGGDAVCRGGGLLAGLEALAQPVSFLFFFQRMCSSFFLLLLALFCLPSSPLSLLFLP